MKKRPALGRGIDALFEEYAHIEEEQDLSRIQMIEIALIDPNKDQPRKSFDDEKLSQLAQSIKSVGILQPIVVARQEGRFLIIAGERRWRAARLAGLSQVPCIVRDAQLIERMEMSLIENIQRDDLNPIDTANAISQLITQCAITQEEAASRLGKSRPAVANSLRLLTLSDTVQQMILQGYLSEGHGRALASVKQQEKQIELAGLVVQRDLSVRQTEMLVKEKKPAVKPKKGKALAELALLEEAARRTFGVKVTAVGSAKKGSLTLHYGSAKELERIYEILNAQ